MLFIYNRVVEKLKKDSIQRYQERKENYRIKNNIPLEEQPILNKQSNNIPPKRQRTFQNNFKSDERQLKPKQEVPLTQNNIISSSNTSIQKQPLKNTVPTEHTISSPMKQTSNTIPEVIKQEAIRPIKPLENPNIQQKQFQEVKLILCPEGCQRQFSAAVLQKHVKICKKVFQTKRNPVDLQQKRTSEFQKVAVSKSSQVAPKKSNFKAESQYFQIIMRQQKGQPLTEEQKAIMKAHEDSKLQECKNCKKRIAPGRMQSHLKACTKIRK